MSNSPIALRRAVAQDRDMLLEWRNDPWIVSLSENRSYVARDEHDAWFGRTLADPDVLLFIIGADGQDIGTVRVTRGEPRKATITIYLLKPFAGRGWGSPAIRSAGEAAFATWHALAEIRARIRADNRPSISAFGKAGYTMRAAGNQQGELVEMQLRREVGARQ